MPGTIEQSCQRLLNNLASDCWTVVLAIVEQSCQRLLKSYARDCWRIVLVTVEQSYQRQLKQMVPVTVKNRVPAAVEQSYQRLLNSRASCFFLLSFFFFTYFGEILTGFCVNTSIISNYFSLGSQLSKVQDYWLIIILKYDFSLPTFINFQKLDQTQ